MGSEMCIRDRMDGRRPGAGDGVREQNPAYRPAHPHILDMPGFTGKSVAESPQRVRATYEGGVHGLPRSLVGVRPEMRVGVERLLGRLVAQPFLHDLHRLPGVDERRGVVMPQRVEPVALDPGVPFGTVNRSPSSLGGWPLMCSASTSPTTWGRGTSRSEVGVFGGPNTGRPALTRSPATCRVRPDRGGVSVGPG